MINQKTNNIAFFIVVTFVYATVCMETDIYVPAFPDMKSFFSTTDEAIQRVLSLNFVGICLGSLLLGPLSDAYGRRKVLLLSLIAFAIASWGCLLFTDFNLFLLCRFIQGLGAAAPMVITFAMMLEKFEPEKVAQLCGGMNLFIAGVMAAAPVLGSFLNLYFGWQANFLLLAILASLSLIGSYLYLSETLAPKDRTTFSLPQMLKDYKTVLMSFPYMAAACVCYFLFGGMIVFIANLSLIFIEHLGVSKSIYGFYQASVLSSFALFSVISIGIIRSYGLEKTKYAGLITAVLGAVLLFITTFMKPDPFVFCGSMAIFTAGLTLAAPIYGMESANVFPQMRGIATGMSVALRYLIMAGIVGLGGLIFNGSMQPVITLITLITAITLILALALLKYRDVPVSA